MSVVYTSINILIWVNRIYCHLGNCNLWVCNVCCIYWTINVMFTINSIISYFCTCYSISIYFSCSYSISSNFIWCYLSRCYVSCVDWPISIMFWVYCIICNFSSSNCISINFCSSDCIINYISCCNTCNRNRFICIS